MKLATVEGTAELVTRATTQYSAELGEMLCLAAMDTPSILHAAAECGVPYRTLRYWLQEGANGHPKYELFAVEFERSRSQHAARYLKSIEEIAADDNPRVATARLRANEFLLKKQYPAQYGDQLFVSTMIERKVDGFDLSVLPTDVLREFMKMLKVIRAKNDGAGEQEVTNLLAKIKIDGAKRTTD